MFGFGFSELVVVGIVALVVLGPEKMPGAVRTAALWIGRMRRSFNTIKQDIEREIGADEIRRQLRNEEIMEKFRNAQAQIQNTIKDVETSAEDLQKNVELEASTAAGGGDSQPSAEPLPGVDALSADQESSFGTPSAPATDAPALSAEAEPSQEASSAASPVNAPANAQL